MSVDELERMRRHEPPLRGRDDAQRHIEQWVDAMAHGEHVPVLIIEGAPGIGKSRLVDEVRRQATSANLAISESACDPIEHDRPFAALTRALGCHRRSPDPTRRALAERCRDLFVDSAEPVAEAQLGRRFGIQDDLVDLLVDASEVTGQVLIIDDAQWLDPFAAAAVASIVRTAGRRRIGVVLARRLHPCPLAVEELLVSISGHAEVIEIGPLTDCAVAAITRDVVGQAPPFPLPPRLAQAGGSPFAVLAVLSSTWTDGGTESSPGTTLRIARASTLARIRAHGDDVEQLLRWASVLGVAFTPDQVALLSGQSLTAVIDNLSRAAADGVLRAQGPSFEFSHDLVAEFVSESIALPLRLAMHREVARRAAELRLRPTLRAHHLLLAAEPGDTEAVAALIAAAEEIARHDPEHALMLLARAEELSAGLAGPQVEIALRRADSLAGLCRVPAAIEVIDSALLIADNVQDVVRLRATRARCRHQIGDILGAADERELLARSGALDAAHEAAAWADVATYRLWGMQGARPFEAANRAIELAEASGVVAPLVQAEAVLGAMAAFDGEVAESICHADRAQERGIALAPHVVIPSPAFTAGLVRLLADDVDESVRILQADQVRIERVGDPLMAARPATAAVIGLYLAGRWDDALVETGALRQLADETGLSIGRLTSQVVSGLIAHHRGDDAAAEEALTRATTAEGLAEGYAIPFLLQLQAARAEAAGDLASAARILGDLASLSDLIAPAIGPWFALDLIRLTMVDLASRRPGMGAVDPSRLWAGLSARPEDTDRESVAAPLAGLAAAAERLARRSDRAVAHAVWHLASALDTGDLEQLRESVGWFQRSPLALHRVAGLELAGVALLWAGCAGEARAILTDAVALAQPLGAERYVDRISDALDGRRARAPKRTVRPTFGFEALTPAEISVLRLLIDGGRNRDIAESLVISKRTVESHVSSMMMKLAVETRVALARTGGEHLGRS